MKVDVKARETQVAVVHPRPSPPPPCQLLTRASSWTACAWQGRHMRAWARARAWSGKARASWARSYRTVGSRSSMRATGGAFSANLPPPPLRVRCPRARHTGWRPHLEREAKTTALRRSSPYTASPDRDGTASPDRDGAAGGRRRTASPDRDGAASHGFTDRTASPAPTWLKLVEHWSFNVRGYACRRVS